MLRIWEMVKHSTEDFILTSSLDLQQQLGVARLPSAVTSPAGKLPPKKEHKFLRDEQLNPHGSSPKNTNKDSLQISDVLAKLTLRLKETESSKLRLAMAIADSTEFLKSCDDGGMFSFPVGNVLECLQVFQCVAHLQNRVAEYGS
jgi:hypothetical protein